MNTHDREHKNRWRGSGGLAYVVALVATGLALLLRLALAPWLFEQATFMPFFMAIIGTAWFGGLRPGLLAAALSALAAAYFLLAPVNSLWIESGSDRLQLGLFCSTAVGICWVCESLHSARRRIEAKRRRLGQEIRERQDAEAGGRGQQERWRVTLASIGDAVVTTDTHGRVAYLNAVAQSLTGWTDQEAEGQPLESVFRIIDEQTRRPVENPVEKVMKLGQVVGLPNHAVLIGKDGTERPIDDSAAPIRDDQGNAVGVVLVFRDVTERRRQEEALAASEQRATHIVESITDGLITLDKEWRVTYVNPRGKELVGALHKTDAEIRGRSIWDEFPASVGTVIEQNYRRAMREQVAVHFEVFYPPAGHWLDIRAYPSRAGLSIYFLDVTDRKRAEEAVRDSEERYRTLFASAPMAVFVCDRNAVIQHFNQRAAELWGREPECGVELHCGSVKLWLLDGTLLPHAQSPMVEVLRTGIPVHNVEVFIERPDGSRLPVLVNFAALKNARGEISGAVTSFVDITERKEAEGRERRLLAETIDATAKFRTLFDQSSVFAGIMTLEGTIIEANRLCLETCGYSAPEVLGRSFWECGWWRGSEEVQAKMRAGTKQAAQGIPYLEVLPYHWADGTARVVDFALHPIRDDKGQIIFLYPTGVDITERKRAEDELQKLTAELSDADRRKDEFLATLAHELRNPLAPLRNGLQIMRLSSSRAAAVDPAVEEARTMMERQLKQMVRLVDDLLDVSRISRGKLELRKKRVELAAVMNNAVETSRPLIEASGHELTVTMPPKPVFLDADVIRLGQVFANLLNNAAKYSERGGRIRLTAIVTGQESGARSPEARGRPSISSRTPELLVSVSDTGVGIPPEMLTKVFDLFTQVDRSLERSQGGLGIGLALVKRLVEMHGGSVEAKSEGRGRGSEFVVRLPLWNDESVRTNEDSETEPAQPSPFMVPPSAKPRILVADDNRDSATTLAMMLEIMGNEVRTANDGLQAVAVAEVFRPDMILLDIGMPKLNGYEACRRIREQPWGTKTVLIALTGWGQDKDKRDSQEAGFNHHMIKPVDPAALEKLLAGLADAATRNNRGAESAKVET